MELPAHIKEMLQKSGKASKSIRAWELDAEVMIWKSRYNLSISPLVWRKWLWAHGTSCWSKGSCWHLYVGPFHIWKANYGTAVLFGLKFNATRNGFWWDKPIKKTAA